MTTEFTNKFQDATINSISHSEEAFKFQPTDLLRKSGLFLLGRPRLPLLQVLRKNLEKTLLTWFCRSKISRL